MDLADLFKSSEFNPLRFAIVVAIIFLAICFSNSTNGQEALEYPNWTTSYDEALVQAERANAPILLYFHGSDWCPWCKKLSKEVFSSREFTAWMDGKLVPVLVDFPKSSSLPNHLAKQNNTLLSRYRPHLTGFPTALFVNVDGTVIGKLGYEEGGVRVWTFKAQEIVARLDKLTMSNQLSFQMAALVPAVPKILE